MSAHSWFHKPLPLPDEEGFLTFFILQQWEEPTNEDIQKALSIEFESLNTHINHGSASDEEGEYEYECGDFVYIKRVSRTKKVLFCPTCGTRIEIPIGIKTYNDLWNHFSNGKPFELIPDQNKDE